MTAFDLLGESRLPKYMLLVLLIGFAACKHGERTPPAENNVPADFEIIFGQQGTFAGRSTGYTIDAAGKVVQWEGKYPGEVEQRTATLEPEHVRRLWEHAVDIGFLEMSDQEMATVNYFISVRAGGESRRVTWTERDEHSLSPAQELFDESMELARAALDASL